MYGAQDDGDAARRNNREAGSFMDPDPDPVPEHWHTLSIRVLAGPDDAMIDAQTEKAPASARARFNSSELLYVP